ncbi:MAG: hypothetical protein COX82_01100 [Candidatus Magasanikbacteria bacterium CG_4_10_14_0_2_um_filter_41_10]|uniref:Uncharacterized protein n=1 Tax=Candidatus Magasanikbacteria bacterium CG_4_10_14_0_2_um_filter_41_10 TaxID=1974638 RepID=A0A2M7V6D1_9BACT|nr:MAG: hypothetical protein COX82_01100 [Candidatus Magasanikbacteria bacterium CG_4_10_14_0_2_um_filter_41_10]
MARPPPSRPWEGKTSEDTQVFFQPDSPFHGIRELENWRFDENEHGQLCVFHDTKPNHDLGLWKWIRVEDDRLRFYRRE